MKILLAPDKFKGSLSAAGVSDAIERGWCSVQPETVFLKAPMADGGEGFCEALLCALDGEWIEVASVDALGRPIQGRYVWVEKTQTAVLEMSEASGLWRLQECELNPRIANTLGTGLLMRDAIKRGAVRVLLGLGGSATTDGGIGMAAALGYEFLAEDGTRLDPVPENLLQIRRIDSAGVLPFPQIVAACDVQNPLLGLRGTATIFAPQKGATPEDVAFLEVGLTNLAGVVAAELGCEFRETPGAGAAGGIGYGLLSFCRAKMEPGFELVAAAVGLEGRIAQVDLVITGEGRLDGQTLEGKGPAGVAALARALGKPVMAFAGSIAEDPAVLERFDAVVPIVDRPISLPEAMAQTVSLLERAAARTARMFTLSQSL